MGVLNAKLNLDYFISNIRNTVEAYDQELAVKMESTPIKLYIGLMRAGQT